MDRNKENEKKEWQKPEIEDLDVIESEGTGGLVGTETGPWGPPPS